MRTLFSTQRSVINEWLWTKENQMLRLFSHYRNHHYSRDKGGSYDDYYTYIVVATDRTYEFYPQIFLHHGVPQWHKH